MKDQEVSSVKKEGNKTSSASTAFFFSTDSVSTDSSTGVAPVSLDSSLYPLLPEAQRKLAKNGVSG